MPFLLALLLLAATSAALPGAAHAAASFPRTLSETHAAGMAPVTPAHPVDFLGVYWQGEPQGEAAVRLRRSGPWTAWRTLHPSDVRPAGGGASELVAARGASAYQVRAPRGARAVRAVAINVSDGPPVPARAGAAQRPAFPGERLPRKFCYRDRAAWHADETLRPAPPAFFPVQRLTIHHTATETGGEDPAAVVRAIQRFHKDVFGFDDIGYQLLIDERGCVYEGRHSGEDGVPVFAGLPEPRPVPEAINGAHAAGYNAGNVGVALLGEFTEEEPSPAALRALALTLASLGVATDLDPLGTGTYVNPISGATKDTAAIAAHRDWLATECPGERLYARLPALRERVARITGRLGR